MKKRRDITLGEMQDECSKRMHICAPDVHGNNECKYFETCKQMRSGVFVKPCPEIWDLSDPPRFNEQQMALLKALSAIGVERIETLDMAAFRMMDKNERHVSLMRAIGLEENELLDLAELFGKDESK